MIKRVADFFDSGLWIPLFSAVAAGVTIWLALPTHIGWDYLRWAEVSGVVFTFGWLTVTLINLERTRMPTKTLMFFGLSYVMYAGGFAWEIIDRIGYEPRAATTIYGPFAVLGGVLSSISLWAYYRPSERERRHGEKSAFHSDRLRKEAGLEKEET